jgi:glycosyltransferase involved in cell wall biosynthesis
LRILILLETLTTGGAEMFGLRLANALAGEHEVMLAVMNGELVEPSLRKLVDGRIRFEALRLPLKRSWFRLDTLLRRLRLDRSAIRAAQARWLGRLVRNFRPDAVHSHLLKADRLALDVRSNRGAAFAHVLTMHGDYAPFLTGQADPHLLHVSRVIRSVLARTDAVVAICDAHRRFLLELDPAIGGKLTTILNGYAPAATGSGPTLPDAPFRFGMVSRGVQQKGWDVAVDAFTRLDRRDACLVLVGDGPHLRELARRPLPAGVHLVGPTGDPVGTIDQCDVCLLPTLFPHESLPTVVIEYLHCGKAVIATDVGEIRSMLTAPDGRLAGRLLDFDGTNVSADQLATFMAEMIDQPALRAEMEDAALAAAQRFDLDRCVQAYLALYARLAAPGPSTSSTSANH